MSVTITNLADTPVAGETDLRQAVAAAKSADTIVLASGNSGEVIQLNSPLVLQAGANLTIDFGAGQDNEIVGTIVVNAGASVTIANVTITDDDVGANSPDVPMNGKPGVAGMAGASGDPDNQNGNNGSNGSGGAARHRRSILGGTPSEPSRISATSKW